ncbi:hypothetical protein JCM14202_1314 [Agrilactobacillus composti DSM 18527 = JCM 14202]|jgi:CopG family transcriptional regulator/antitoxin EndoAI|nr:hypothetical protein [Agrilactobacillus composti]MCH4172431.1 hypothetical protein [Lactobacillus sp.]GAF39451.1 hypothetical protein JCM14202_1314 [Agrilactobacillus composti DSM 18527 = JCM 14202]
MEQKQLLVKVDAKLTQEVETYCSIYSVDEQEVIQSALSEYLEQRQETMRSLIAGYTEMASINSEICQEFSACESEAYLHTIN